MRRVCIIGHAADKFTPETEKKAKGIIAEILTNAWSASVDHPPVLVSGKSPMGGIDEWAEEAADLFGLPKDIKPPAFNKWQAFKARNLDMARVGDEFHVLVVDAYPPGYWERPGAKPPKEEVMRDGKPWCYHCRGARPVHVKSGACWTALQAMAQGKPAEWRFIA